MASLRDLVETAFKTYLDTQSIGATVYKGLSHEDKTLPAIICSARQAEEDPLMSGNYRVSVIVEIKDAASAASTFDAVCDSVKTALWDTDIAANLMGTPATLQIWGVGAESKVEWDTQDDCWVERHEIQLYCCKQTF